MNPAYLDTSGEQSEEEEMGRGRGDDFERGRDRPGGRGDGPRGGGPGGRGEPGGRGGGPRDRFEERANRQDIGADRGERMERIRERLDRFDDRLDRLEERLERLEGR